MTIRDMEERTGISRANIRCYESEGLIRPARRENGITEVAPDPDTQRYYLVVQLKE